MQPILPLNGPYACVSNSMNDEPKTGPQAVASVSSPQPVSYGWGIGSIGLGIVGGFTSYILPFPWYWASCFSIALLLVGLVLGIVGTFKKNSSVVLSIAGTVLCGLLLVFIVLSMFMLGASGLLEGSSEPLLEQPESAQVDAARTQMEVLEIAIVAYQMDTRTCPPSLDALLVAPPARDPSRWQGPYLELTAVPLDPWDRPYQYIPDEEGPTIFSVGPDGVANTADDVVHVVTW